mgnify:CR=1 FL=1
MQIFQSVAMADREHVLTEKLLQMPMQVDAIGADVEKWDRKGPLDQYLDNLEKEIIREVMISGTRSSLLCKSYGMELISSSSRVPPLACSKSPALSIAPVNPPFVVPNKMPYHRKNS